MKLGVLGGTFDPPHIGHLIAAQEAWRLLGLDRVIFVPAAEPPHKRGQPITPAATRLAMLRAAVDGDERFEVSELELQRAGPSYSADTLEELRRSHPSAELFFLLGADQVRELHTWRRPDDIARLATVVAVARAGDEAPAPSLDVPFRTIAIPRVDISSSDVRRRVAEGEPVSFLVPPPVESIIVRARLYR